MRHLIKSVRPLLLALTMSSGYASGNAASGIDAETGLVIAPGFPVVKAYCTACHSARVVMQAGKTREGWLESIRWMQRTQGLFDLGPSEGEILDYLATNYGIKAKPGGMLSLPPLRPPAFTPPPAAQ